MKLIYIMTAGDYSDYRILGVFDDKSLFDIELEKYNKDPKHGEYARLEEFYINQVGPIPAGYNAYFVWMTQEGEATEVQKLDEDEMFMFDLNEVKGDNREVIDGILVNTQVRFSVVATDITHAIKIANEKRAQIIAFNQWNKYITTT